MKHTVITLLMLAGFDVKAQSRDPNQCPQAGPNVHPRLWWNVDNSPEAEQQRVQRMTAKQKEQQFLVKTEKFIASWTALVGEYNEKGTFNVKKGKKVSKAFHDLEKSEGWPK